MTLRELKDKFFPPEYGTITAIVYTTCALVVYVMGISSLKVLPRLIIQINGIATLFAIVILALYAYKRPDRLEAKRGFVLRAGHCFLAAGLLASLLQSLLTGTTRSLTVFPFALLFLTLFLCITAMFMYSLNRSRHSVDQLLRDRGQIASKRFIFGTGGLIALSMMRPKRRFVFLGAEIGLMAAMLTAGSVLLIDHHYVVAGILFVGFFAAVEILESVMYAEVVERKSVEGELNAARTIQMGLMPKEDPVVEGFEISGRCVPANEVGGDFFDYVWLDERKTKFGIALADVSGKALKAAMTAVMTSGMVYQEIGNNDSPKSILQKINRPMYLKTDRQVFTALSFAVIDVNKKTLRFSNAGQSQPILQRKGSLRYIKVKGARLPLGVQENQNYEEAMMKLQKGDLLLFYTDGLPEATNPKHELLGFEAVEAELSQNHDGSASEVVQRMIQLVDRHTGKSEQHDDMTVVVVKVV